MGQGLAEDPRAQLWEVLWGRLSGSTRAGIEQCALQTCCAPAGKVLNILRTT